MKISSVAPLALSLVPVVYACNSFTPVVTCYNQPLCDENGDLFIENGMVATIQQCSTNFGVQGGPGIGGGGGSCTCVEDDGTMVCATFKRIWRGQNRLQVSRTNFETGAKLPDKDLMLKPPIFVGGDPHVKGWSGNWYDWHGQCDTVMLQTPDFADGAGLEIHIRSKIRYDYSFIETMAIKIGGDILEVSGYGHYFVNGVLHAGIPGTTMGGFELTHTLLDQEDHDHGYTIQLGNGAHIAIHTHNDLVGVGLDLAGGVLGRWFTNSTGLMGSFENGDMLARDGVTILEDPNAMGQEWQVQPSEPKLFQNANHEPQYPQKCMVPSPDAKESRRLGETISLEAAKKACAHWETEDARERCIYDVMAVGDLGMATVGAI